MMSTLSRPPCAAGGILLNSIEAPGVLCRERHPQISRLNSRRICVFPSVERDNPILDVAAE
jgi:hypothetical protein